MSTLVSAVSRMLKSALASAIAFCLCRSDSLIFETLHGVECSDSHNTIDQVPLLVSIEANDPMDDIHFPILINCCHLARRLTMLLFIHEPERFLRRVMCTHAQHKFHHHTILCVVTEVRQDTSAVSSQPTILPHSFIIA